MADITPEPDPLCGREGCGHKMDHIDTVNGTETWACPKCFMRSFFHVYEPKVAPDTKATFGEDGASAELRNKRAQLATLSPACLTGKIERCLHCKLTTAVDGDHLCAVCRVMNDHFTYGASEPGYVQ